MAIRTLHLGEDKSVGSQDATIAVEALTAAEKYPGIDLSYVLISFAKVVREEIRVMEEGMIERVIERIDYRINELIEKQNIKEGGATEEVIMLRSISREQAKEEIVELFDKSDKLYYSDIVEALKLDLEEVVEIVEELKAEGEVGEAD
ncbi:MAG: hypothetical protein WBC40_08220 [Halobacteriota archaeon]